VASLRDAERFLSATAKQGKRWSVPSRARTFLAPAEMPKPTSGFLLEGFLRRILICKDDGRNEGLPTSPLILSRLELQAPRHYSLNMMFTIFTMRIFPSSLIYYESQPVG